jgi:predicted Rossmann fold flavoprotein
MQDYDVIILGGGAAGLMCASAAGQRGYRVIVLESSNKIGKKILMSGGGRCNFTNLHCEPDRFVSENPRFCISALSRYTQWDFIELVQRHNIPYHEKSQGQLFCDNSSKDIVNMLQSECDAVDVRVVTHCEIDKVQSEDGYQIFSNQGDFTAPTLRWALQILATASRCSSASMYWKGERAWCHLRSLVCCTT